MTSRLGLNRRPNRIAASEELMQAQGKDRKPTRLATSKSGHAQQEPPQDWRTLLHRVSARQLGKLLGSTVVTLQSARRLSDQLSSPRFRAHAERGLNPRREWMQPEGFVVGRRFCAVLDCSC